MLHNHCYSYNGCITNNPQTPKLKSTTDSVGQELGQEGAGMAYPVPSFWDFTCKHLKVESDSMAEKWNRLATSLCSSLVIHAGCWLESQLGLLSWESSCGLSIALGSQVTQIFHMVAQSFKREFSAGEVEATSLSLVWPSKSLSITFSAFY